MNILASIFSTASRVDMYAPTSWMNGMPYFSSVASLDRQSARKTTSSAVRYPTMSMEWPGSGMIENPSGRTPSVRGSAVLGWAMRNLCLSSLGGHPA